MLFAILREQASRTQDVNDWLEERQLELFRQLEGVKSLGCTASVLIESVQQELLDIAGQDKWF